MSDAAQIVRLVLVERGSQRVSVALLGGLLTPGRRGPIDPFLVEIRDMASGRVLAVRGAGHSRAEANGVLCAMQADLDRLDIATFTKRWRGQRPSAG